MLKINDIKYIIKRVIIILITGLIFYFIRSCPVKADDLNQTINLTQDRRYFDSSYSSSKTFLFSYELSKTFLDNIGTDYNITINNYNSNNTSSSYTKYILFYNSTLEQYILSKYENISSLNLTYNNESNYFDYYLGTSYFLFKYDENSSTKGFNCGSSTCFPSGSSYSSYSLNTSDSKKIGIMQNLNSTALNSTNLGMTLDYEIIDTNIENLTINNEPYENFYPGKIPQGYEEINLTGYQGVVIVPKDYTQLQIESINDIDFYQFPYYYKGCQSYGYFSLQNNQMLVSDLSNINVCSENIQKIDGIFPVYYNDINSITGIGTQSYQSNAIVIYNRNIIDSGYGETKIYINKNLFNYELVSDFDNFNSNFTYIDKQGNEFTQNINNVFSFEKLLENGINQENINSNLDTKQKLNILFSYVKLPFNFLNSLTESTCSPLRARFPHSDKYIELPCISNVIEEHFSQEFLSFIRIIVNGFVIYRVVISMTIFVTSQINPSSLRLEVLDL